MQLVCATQSLARAVRAVARLSQGKHNPGPEAVLLLASPPLPGVQSTCTVLGWKAEPRAGLFASLPAQITRPGQASVPAARLADYLATLRAPAVHLSQESYALPDSSGAEPSASQEIPPLTIACTWTSDGGNAVRRTCHLVSSQVEVAPDLPLERWRSASELIATLPARELRAALAICAPLALSRKGKEQLPDLFGILVHFESEGLRMTATTKWDLASQQVAVPLSSTCAEPCRVLFTGSDLVWLSKNLRDEELITLRLAHADEQAVLLVETAEMTLFCTGRTTSLPTHWEAARLWPISGHLVVVREAFAQAVAQLVRAARKEEVEDLQLMSRANQLCLCLARARTDPEQAQTTLAIARTPTPLPVILLDLKRTSLLIRKLRGTTIALEWGSIVQRRKDGHQVVGFLRLICETVGTTLVMVRSDLPEEAAHPDIPVALSEGNTTSIVSREAQEEGTQPSAEETPADQSCASPAVLPAVPVFRKGQTPMPTLPSLLAGAHADDALAQLALSYHRQTLQDARPSVSRQACAWIRDLLLSAPDQQAAQEQLQARLADGWSETESSFWRPACQQASSLLQQVMDAGGSLHPLVVGITDGFRHLCLRCGQDADKRQGLRFFRERDRRWLLTPEIGPIPRSVYERCQSCLQPLFPGEAVVFAPGGTIKHPSGCSCQECNQRGLAFVLHIYACERQTQQIVLPHLAQVVAPSRQQGVERAVALCWRQGWYMLSEDPRAHALSTRALASSQEETEPQAAAPLA